MFRTKLLAPPFFLLLVLSCSHTPHALNDGASVLQMRDDFLLTHPDGKFNRFIERGEVVRGMNFVEVSASWGIPETRSLSKDRKLEYWTFFGFDDLSEDWTRYTFVFEKGVLADWDVNRHFSKNGSLSQWSISDNGGRRLSEETTKSNGGESPKR